MLEIKTEIENKRKEKTERIQIMKIAKNLWSLKYKSFF